MTWTFPCGAGLAAPAGTPDDVIAMLQAAAEAAVMSDAFQEASENIGFTPAFMPAAEFGVLIAQDDAFYGALLNELGMAQ